LHFEYVLVVVGGQQPGINVPELVVVPRLSKNGSWI
jgi:hypothetical protein